MDGTNLAKGYDGEIAKMATRRKVRRTGVESLLWGTISGRRSTWATVKPLLSLAIASDCGSMAVRNMASDGFSRKPNHIHQTIRTPGNPLLPSTGRGSPAGSFSPSTGGSQLADAIGSVWNIICVIGWAVWIFNILFTMFLNGGKQRD